MDLETKLTTIEGCLKSTNSEKEFTSCISPMTIEESREALSELDVILKNAKK